jgi:hypothetical protein
VVPVEEVLTRSAASLPLIAARAAATHRTGAEENERPSIAWRSRRPLPLHDFNASAEVRCRHAASPFFLLPWCSSCFWSNASATLMSLAGPLLALIFY